MSSPSKSENETEACFALAQAMEETGPLMLAVEAYQRLLKIAPYHSQGQTRLESLRQTVQEMNAWYQKGSILYKQGDMENAVAAYRQALSIHPRVPEALANLSLALYHLRHFDEAQKTILEALRLRPEYAEALNTLGNICQNAENYEGAIEAYRRALRLRPDYFNVHANLGKTLQKMKDDAGAVAAYEEALRISPDQVEILGELLYRLHYLCRWDKVSSLQKQIEKLLSETNQCMGPFVASLYTSPSLQLKNAQCWTRQHYPIVLPYDVLRPLPSKVSEKLRVGYLSSDFHRHATAHLISEMFEQHDRNSFEIYAYSSGLDDKSPERTRIIKTVDAFCNISNLDTKSAVGAIQRDKIDILVDLKGYTQNHRMDVMALRPAPLQMHYLGFPGTTGAACIDYFIADTIAAPSEIDDSFSECLIHLPFSYQINDRSRPLPTDCGSRTSHGLPEHGFVFCGFNQAYKITPTMFDVWIHLLKSVDGSVLWLYEQSTETSSNLRQKAQSRGINPARIMFAKHASLAEHLARYHHVDLFLDTSPVCGHTTASDALWCGVPVITIAGKSFASRVATSLLHAVNLPELVTVDIKTYESMALALANDPQKIDELKQHLKAGRLQFPLFDSIATTRALEAAYYHAVARHRNTQAPHTFSVTADFNIL